MNKLFRILEITNELVNDILSRTYQAHWHDFEEIIIVTEGSLEHFIDFQIETVNAPAVCYISMNKAHKVVPKADLRGWIINYKNEFVPDSKFHFYSNFFTETSIPMLNNTCVKRYESLCRIICDEYKQEFADQNTLRHLVSALISMVDTERQRNIPADESQKAVQTKAFNTFLKYLEANFKTNEGVSFYASKLNMTERNLNLICKNNFQKSVTEIIETRKLIEAKRLLLHTEKSVSEIGYELGYNEKSYFTRVFHNKMGLTPTRFRESTKALIA
jgi:AraC family transcriptional regulator, transcriptional activator of pobA